MSGINFDINSKITKDILLTLLDKADMELRECPQCHGEGRFCRKTEPIDAPGWYTSDYNDYWWRDCPRCNLDKVILCDKTDETK